MSNRVARHPVAFVVILILTILIAFGPYFVVKAKIADIREDFGGDSSLWNDMPIITWGIYEDIVEQLLDFEVYRIGVEIAEIVLPENDNTNVFNLAEDRLLVVGIVTSLWLFPVLFGLWVFFRSRQQPHSQPLVIDPDSPPADS